ncbi:MAG TPA: Cna B-type domain-containing protein [Erysipelothrix sp.]
MRKVNQFILSCLLMISSVIMNADKISADSSINSIIDHISFSTSEAYVGTGVQMDVTFSEKSDYKIKENDVVVIPLPKGSDGESNFFLKGKPTSFELKQDGIVLAEVRVENEQIVVTFTKEAAALNEVKGSLRAHLTADSDYQGTSGKSHVITTDYKEFNVANQSINIIIADKVAPGPSDYPFFYKGGYTSSDPSVVNWYLNTNLNRGPVEGNVVLKDRLQAGHYLLVDSVKAIVTPHKGSNEIYSISELKEKYPDVIVDAYNGGIDIFIPFHRVHYTSFEFQYQSKVISTTIENLENGVDITYYENGEQVNLHESAQTANELFTGSIQGQKPQKGYLRVVKTVEDTEAVVESALFNIYQNGQLIHANLATNAQGYFDVALDPGTYQVKEVKTLDWLELDDQPQEITMTVNQSEGSVLNFKNQRKKIDLKVTKKWHASQEQISKDKDKVKVALLIDGQISDQIQKFDETNQAVFKGLPITDIYGEKIDYSIKEIFEQDLEDNYISEISGNQTAGFIIQNFYNGPKAQIRIPITKIWQDGPKEKPEIAIEILKVIDDETEKREVVETLIFPETTEKEVTILSAPLDKYDDQHNLITYEIREKMPAEVSNNYEAIVNQKEKVITNRFKYPLEDITVTKVWDHQNNENLEDIKVVFQLYRKSEGTEWQVVEGAQHQFIPKQSQREQEYTFKNLDKYDEEGNRYEYRVEEIGQTQNYQSERISDLIIKNTYNPKITNLNILKVWENEGPEGDITLELLQNNRVIEQIILEKGTYWHTFSNLPTFDNQGKAYHYDINEVSFPEHYESRKEVHDGGIVFYNTYDVGTTEMTAEKHWMGGPKEKPTIEVQLMYEDENGHVKPVLKSGQAVINKIVYPETKTHFNNLPKRNHLGNDIIYSVKERALKTDDYISFENGNYITNLYRTPYQEVKGSKTWIGGPIDKESITVQLYQKIGNEEKKLVGYKKTLLGQDALINETLSEKHQTNVKEYAFSFGYLPTRNREGQEIEYFVKEVTVQDNYVTTGTGMHITNTYQVPKTDFTVHKIWENGPQEKPQIELYLQNSLDQKNWHDTDYSITLKSNERHYTFTGLDETNHLGEKIYYRVIEKEALENYAISYPSNDTVKNTYIIPTTDLTVKKIWENGPLKRPDITLALEKSIDHKTWELTDYRVNLSSQSTSHTFNEVPVTDELGQIIAYRVRELTELNDYETIYLPDSLTVINRFVDLPSEKPSDKPDEKPSDKPGEKPSGKPGAQPSDKPVEQPNDSAGSQGASEKRPDNLPITGVSNTLVPVSLLVIAIGLILHFTNKED